MVQSEPTLKRLHCPPCPTPWHLVHSTSGTLNNNPKTALKSEAAPCLYLQKPCPLSVVSYFAGFWPVLGINLWAVVCSTQPITARRVWGRDSVKMQWPGGCQIVSMWDHRYQNVDASLAAAVCHYCASILERSRSAKMSIERCRLHCKINCNSLNSEPIFTKCVLL